MPLEFNNGVKVGRNQLCPCGLGLKYKHCHGDPSKKNIVQRIADEAMVRLIAQELLKKGMICKHGVRTGEKCFDCENPDAKIDGPVDIDGGTLESMNENSDEDPNIITL